MRNLTDFKLTGSPVTPSGNVGERAELCLLPITMLVVDERYQRRISAAGHAHIRRIVETFDWRKFTPVIVAATGEGTYAIIDGQHRATAAMLHPAIDMVPCMVVKATPQEAADAFAAINGAVTKLSKGNIYKARLLACEPEAVAVAAACRAAGVTPLVGTHPTRSGGYQPGETMALGAIERCLKTYGHDVLVTALKGVVGSGHGNAGNLRGPIIFALCEALSLRPSWRGAGLVDLMDDIDLEDELANASQRARRNRTSTTAELLAMFCTRMTQARLGAPASQEARP